MLKFSDQKSNRRKFSVALRYKHEKYNEDCVQTKVKHQLKCMSGMSHVTRWSKYP